MDFMVLIIAAGLGLIPANIAKNKGHSFGLWWLYGWCLFIIAIIHVQFIKDYNAPDIPVGVSAAEELYRFKKLYDEGVLTEEEFNRKKENLLK